MCDQRVTPTEASSAQIALVLLGILGLDGRLLRVDIVVLVTHLGGELFNRIDVELLVASIAVVVSANIGLLCSYTRRAVGAIFDMVHSGHHGG